MSLAAKAYAPPEASIVFIIDGGGAVITTGEKGHIPTPLSCTITSVELEADRDGSIKVDIWKDNYASFPPTNADTICGGNEPEIAAAQKYKDTTLTGWTKDITEGDILAFNVDSILTMQRVTVTLHVEKT